MSKRLGRSNKLLITKTEAKTLYGIRDFSSIPCDVRRRYTLYARADLDKHMLDTFGSRMEWLRSIAQRDMRVKKRAVAKRQKREDYNAFLKTFPVEFGAYMKQLGRPLEKSELEQSCKRFVNLSTALEEQKLRLRTDSRLCQHYVVSGIGCVEEIVETMEEMSFLFAHTTYAARCNAKISAFREDQYDWHDWYPRDEYDDILQEYRNDAKMELWVAYLEDDKDLTLPHKWKKCRGRFERVMSAGQDPRRKLTYIYTGRGKTPAYAPSPTY